MTAWLPRRVACFVLVFGLFGCGADPQAKIDRGQGQVNRIAEDLGVRKTPSGADVPSKESYIKEKDPWGVPIQVVYSQGGIARTILVRSAGPDRQFDTRDDIEGSTTTANLSGIGAGLKKELGEAAATATDVAESALEGAIAGARKSLDKAIAPKNDDAQTATKPEATQPESKKPR